MQREHSRSDSKNQRLQWETITEEGIDEPPRKRKRLNSDDEAQQEIIALNRSQMSTPPGGLNGVGQQDGSSLAGDDL